jgi:beta-glucanase (GH16 family)
MLVGKRNGGSVAFLVFFSALVVEPTNAAPPSGRYNLAWEESFHSEAFYHANWSFRLPGWRKEGYLNTVEMVVTDFDAGRLRIKTTFNTPPKGGMISTHGKRWFSHGYFAVKMTLPRHPGHHVAFWMKSDEYDLVGPSKTHGAEIDVIEYLPLQPRAAHFNIHTFGYGAQHKALGHKAENIVCAGCTHEFGLDWRPDGYTFYVDGVAHWTTTEATTSVPHFLILSSHVSSWGGYPKFGAEPDEVTIHYVRYYKRLE